MISSRTRRYILLQILACTAVLFTHINQATCEPQRSKKKTKKPNVFIIFADDVGTGDVPGYWKRSGLVHMPNLEHFLTQGTTFTDAHSTPLCAPSRYVLLSGNYQHRGNKFGGSWTINYEGNQFRRRQRSMADVFKANGYKTSMYGKWHLGGVIPTVEGYQVKIRSNPHKETLLSNANHDWYKPIGQGPSDIGFDHSYVTLAGVQNPPYVFLRNDAVETDMAKLAFWPIGNFSMPAGLSKIEKAGEGAGDWDTSAYNMILVDEAEQFLDDHLENDPDQPFFTYLALGAVHTPHSPPDTYRDGTPISGTYPTPHMDVLSEMDHIVGSVYKMLQERNLLDDTILVFTSDNGGLGMETGSDSAFSGHFSGGPLRSEKASIYEGGHRIPMTISWPNGNVPKGERRSHYVGLSDIFATLCDLVGIEVPKRQALDSVSFARYLLNEKKTKGLRKTLGFWSFVKHGNSFRLGQESIRMGDLKLIHDYQMDTFELYNLANDISETTNLVTDNNSTIVQEMYHELKQIGPCHDIEGRFLVRQQNMTRSCAWFGRKNTFKRCEKFLEGWKNCRLTCAMRSSKQCKRIVDLATRKKKKKSQ